MSAWSEIHWLIVWNFHETSQTVLAITAYMFFKTLWFCHKCTLKNNFPFLVPLVFFICKLVDPSKFCITILTHDISHHMPTCKHDTILNFTVGQVDNLVEEEGTSCSTWTRNTNTNFACGKIALVKALFSIEKYWYFSYFSIKTYVVGTP